MMDYGLSSQFETLGQTDAQKNWQLYLNLIHDNKRPAPSNTELDCSHQVLRLNQFTECHLLIYWTWKSNIFYFISAGKVHSDNQYLIYNI